MTKRTIADFAFYGGRPLFESIRSISNLVRPDFERFLEYSRLFYADGRYSHAGRVEQLLESRLAAFHEVAHCVSFCGGFWGLVLAMQGLALPGRHEVVMPSLTYRRLADIVSWAGLTPHFCEVDPEQLCITAETARPCINDNTALLLGVHPIVNCCDADGLEALSRESGVPLLFDAVESSYETTKGRRVGSLGRAECFSMQSSKLLNAFEGGYVTTNDDALARRLQSARDLGEGPANGPIVPAINARQNEIHAAMALAALDGVDEQVARNRRRYAKYKEGLAEISSLRLVPFDERDRNGYKNVVVELLDTWPITRELTLELMHQENMLVRPYYFPPLHEKKTGYQMIWKNLSQTEALSRRFLLLPCGHFVSEDDVEVICRFLGAIHDLGPQFAAQTT